MALRPVDDTIARKVNASDASAFAKICGCFPSQGKRNIPYLSENVLIVKHSSQKQVWGVIWLVIAFIFFILGILVGIVAFKVRYSGGGGDNLGSGSYSFSDRNRRLSRKKILSTFCPRPGPTARSRCCRYRHRLHCYSAPCHPYYSPCYDSIALCAAMLGSVRGKL